MAGNPRPTLSKISEFIEHDLDYERIRQVGIGSVSEPNTSFADSAAEGFSPVGRWKRGLCRRDLEMLEGLIGATLEELNYPLATNNQKQLVRARLKLMRTVYRTYFQSKFWAKNKTPLGRLFVTRNLSWL